jgi:hypothetical protein
LKNLLKVNYKYLFSNGTDTMSQISQDTSNPHSQELEQIVGALSKITSRTAEEIKPYLNELLDRLSQKKEDFASASFYATSTHEEWSAEFHHWVDSHQGEDIPVLSDSAMSRESMYPDRF